VSQNSKPKGKINMAYEKTGIPELDKIVSDTKDNVDTYHLDNFIIKTLKGVIDPVVRIDDMDHHLNFYREDGVKLIIENMGLSPTEAYKLYDAKFEELGNGLIPKRKGFFARLFGK